MSRFLAVAVVAAALLVPSVVMADGTCEPGFVCLKTQIIYGRPPKPLVVIELQHPSAAKQAGVAHEDMRAEWIQKLEPATLRPSQQH
jgi:hypothetical protein